MIQIWPIKEKEIHGSTLVGELGERERGGGGWGGGGIPLSKQVSKHPKKERVEMILVPPRCKRFLPLDPVERRRRKIENEMERITMTPIFPHVGSLTA
jgi:hypothetical protein